MNIALLQADLKSYFIKRGLKSSVSIAIATGIPQSTVYRALERKNAKLTAGLRRLVNYSNIEIEVYKEVDPTSNDTLMSTIRYIWDGSEAHARQISKLLLAAHSCKIASENALGRHSGRD